MSDSEIDNGMPNKNTDIINNKEQAISILKQSIKLLLRRVLKLDIQYLSNEEMVLLRNPMIFIWQAYLEGLEYKMEANQGFADEVKLTVTSAAQLLNTLSSISASRRSIHETLG